MKRRDPRRALKPVKWGKQFRILWSGDSIHNNASQWAQVSTAMPNDGVVHDLATYGGNVIGGGLLEVADETQAYVNSAWSARTRGTPYSDYAAVIFQFGRNDANNSENATEFRKAYDKLVAQGRKYFPRVAIGTPPPKALANLSDWDPDNDAVLTGGYDEEIDTVVTKYNVQHINVMDRFIALEDAATYTVAQLMRDAYHPTYDTGGGIIATDCVTAMKANTLPDNDAAEVTGRVVNYLYGEPASGAWALVSTTNTTGPTQGPLPRISDQADQGLSIAASGATVEFPDTTVSEGGQVWFHYYTQASSGGTVDFYVDRGTGSEKKISVNTTDSALGTNYPKAILVGDDLSAGSHTISAETTSANRVTLLGVTVNGAS